MSFFNREYVAVCYPACVNLLFSLIYYMTEGKLLHLRSIAFPTKARKNPFLYITWWLTLCVCLSQGFEAAKISGTTAGKIPFTHI